MRTNAYPIPYSKLNKHFVEAFNAFENWHLMLWEELKESYPNREPLLEDLFPEKQGYVLQQIEQIATLRSQLPPGQDKLHQAFCQQSILNTLLCETPYYAQCIQKPRGYPGDAEIMDMIYRDAFEGDTPFAKIIHRIGTQADTGKAIRKRKDLVKREIQAIGSGKVLSLAAGPAREIHELLKENSTDTYKFLALDHDIYTLRKFGGKGPNSAFSYGIANAFHFIKGRNKVLIPHRSMLNLCDPKRDRKGWQAFALPFKYKIHSLRASSFDMVYSIGLYDYIKTFPDPSKGTKALTQFLFNLLKPGGTLLLGNVTPELPQGIRWVMEHICDWYLIYRENQQLYEFLEAIPTKQIASADILQEDLGINAFLKVVKK